MNVTCRLNAKSTEGNCITLRCITCSVNYYLRGAVEGLLMVRPKIAIQEYCNDEKGTLQRLLTAEKQTFLARCSSQPRSLPQKPGHASFGAKEEQEQEWTKGSLTANSYAPTLICLADIIPSPISLLCLSIASHHSFRDWPPDLYHIPARFAPSLAPLCVCWSLHQRIPKYRVLFSFRTRMQTALPAVILSAIQSY